MNEEFTSSDLVELYDLLNPWGPDNDFYLDLIEKIVPSQVLSILDLGCGTGMLARALVLKKHYVVGIDCSLSMLTLARTGPGGDRIKWIQGTAQTFSIGHKFDFILMSGHAFQYLLSDHDIETALCNMARHVNRYGQIVFETRNPDVPPWNLLTGFETRQTVLTRNQRLVEVSMEAGPLNADRVNYDTCYRFLDDGAIFQSAATLKFSNLVTLESKLTRAGLAMKTVHGDWNGNSFTNTSPEIIVTAVLKSP